MRVQNGEFHVIEKFCLTEEEKALRFEFLLDGGVVGDESDAIDRADTEHGGG